MNITEESRIGRSACLYDTLFDICYTFGEEDTDYSTKAVFRRGFACVRCERTIAAISTPLGEVL